MYIYILLYSVINWFTLSYVSYMILCDFEIPTYMFSNSTYMSRTLLTCKGIRSCLRILLTCQAIRLLYRMTMCEYDKFSILTPGILRQ